MSAESMAEKTAEVTVSGGLPQSGSDISDLDKAVIATTADFQYIKPQMRRVHDPDVLFEEYHHYAKLTREEERDLPKPKTNWAALLTSKKEAGPDAREVARQNMPTEHELANRIEITDEEWTNASRAFRTASAGACFYLITTDILGPYGVAFSLGTMGWGPGAFWPPRSSSRCHALLRYDDEAPRLLLYTFVPYPQPLPILHYSPFRSSSPHATGENTKGGWSES